MLENCKRLICSPSLNKVYCIVLYCIDAISPKYGGKIVAWNQDIGFISLASSYLILCGSLMSHALPSVPLTQAAWTCCAAAIVLPTVFLKSYSQIA